MSWLINIIVWQFVIGMICTSVLYLIWRIANPGQKW